ncbi:MAG: hypothetical protein ACM34O_17070 [Ignavibacteria bacterium]
MGNTYQDAADKKILIINAVNNELKLHPEATLIDIYKIFFQGAYGPAHMIADRTSALNCIAEELSDTAKYDTVLWQQTGYENRYFRVNLSIVKDKILSMEKLADAFFKSANNSNPPSLESWKKEWEFILDAIKGMGLTINNFTEDKKFLNDMLESGEMIVHHSEIYIKLYNPHYRVISARYVEEFKLK